MISMDIQLREWLASDFSEYERSTKNLERRVGRLGRASAHYETAVSRLKAAAADADREALVQALNSRVSIRAFADLLCDNDEFRSVVLFDARLITEIRQSSERLGLLPLLKLVSVYFREYDDLPQTTGSSLRRFLNEELSKRESDGLRGALGRMVTHRDVLLSGPSHMKVAERALNTDEQLTDVLDFFGVAEIRGRYHQRCQQTYFLETLRQINVGEDHIVLSELSERQVFESSWEDDRRLGHEIIEILIERTGSRELSDAWRDLILRIAGDPRVPSSSTRYQNWWAHIRPAFIVKMKGWLSRLDLSLFLETLRASAVSSGDSTKLRMFESRKKFMEGLLDQGLVEESRLFLCWNDEQYLKRQYRRESELPSFAKIVDSSNTSVIYLRVAGFHMVEGSHNFKLKIMDELPEGFELTDYSKTRYNDYSLRRRISDQYYLQFPDRIGYRRACFTEIVHNGAWEQKAIGFFRANHITVKSS